MTTTEPSPPEPLPELAVENAPETPARRRVSWPLVAVAALSLGPSLVALALRLVGVEGVDAASAEFLRPAAHGLVEWTAALVALVAGLLAYARWRGTGEDELETVALAFALPAVAVLDAFHALLPWAVSPARFDLLLGLTWNTSRWFLALTLTVGLAVAWGTSSLERPPDTRRLFRRFRSLVPAVVACLAFVGLDLLARNLNTDSESIAGFRPWELGPLVLFLLSARIWAPDVASRRASGLSQGLLLSFLPQVLCQLEMLVGSLVLGHWQKLLAYAVIAAGALGDHAAALRRQDTTHRTREDIEAELQAKVEELERLDLQRLAQEEARREAEQNLRMLAKAVETMSLGVTITDMEGRIIYVNPADARVHGYTVAELIGRDSRIYAAGDSIDGAEDTLEPWARERSNRTRSGEVFPVRLVSDRVRDDDGQPIATVTICEDIRERIRIREALERRDRILEAVAFAAECFLSESEWETSVSDVLERLGEATGVDRVYLDLINEAYPFGIEDFTYYWSALGEVDERLSEGGGTNRVELVERWETLLREGRVISGRVSELPIEERPVFSRRGVRSFSLVPLFVQARWQGFLCLEATAADRDWSHVELEALKAATRTFGMSIQRRRDEEALAASEAKYRQLLEGAHDLVQSVSPDGRFEFVNRSWKETLGYAEEEIRGLTVWDVVRPAHPDSRRDVLQSMLTDDGLGRVEALFVGKEGREIAVEGQVTTRFEDGLPVAAQGIFRDITERRQLDRMKQEFISTVSHELRTPLTSIIASLGLLDSGRLAGQPERYEELITVAHRNSTRLLGLINNLLDLQKLAARKMHFKSDPVDVRALLEEAVRSIRAFAEQSKVGLILEPVPEGLELLGDRDRLMQVLNNLVSNAIKFSPAGEEVVVSGYRRHERVVLTVADHGPGIPDEFRSRLFDQFTQADPSKTRSSGGSGLGLSIAKGLVEGMRGRIDLDTRIDEGTTFYVDLPAADRGH